MSKKGISTQVGLVRLCRISREGAHTALSYASQPLAQDLKIRCDIFPYLPSPLSSLPFPLSPLLSPLPLPFPHPFPFIPPIPHSFLSQHLPAIVLLSLLKSGTLMLETSRTIGKPHQMYRIRAYSLQGPGCLILVPLVPQYLVSFTRRNNRTITSDVILIHLTPGSYRTKGSRRQFELIRFWI
jgi:hypothetical protein